MTAAEYLNSLDSKLKRSKNEASECGSSLDFIKGYGEVIDILYELNK
jgi:hypothetical protein